MPTEGRTPSAPTPYRTCPLHGVSFRAATCPACLREQRDESAPARVETGEDR